MIDFPPRNNDSEVAGSARVSGRGHGMPLSLLVAELTAAGFVVEEKIEQWHRRQYCLIVSKPAPRPLRRPPLVGATHVFVAAASR